MTLTRSIPGPDDITRTTLPNGITVLTRPNFQSQSVVLSGFLQVGALFDPDEKLGLARFTAGMLLRGTEHYTFDGLYDLLEANGARLAFSGHTHTTGLPAQRSGEIARPVVDLFGAAGARYRRNGRTGLRPPGLRRPSLRPPR